MINNENRGINGLIKRHGAVIKSFSPSVRSFKLIDDNMKTSISDEIKELITIF